MARYDGALGSDDRPVDIKTDNKGFIYVTGFSSEANKDFITIKYDSNGNEIWRRNHNGLANMRDEAESIIVDYDGNVYVAGVITSKKNHTNRCIIKYSPDGNEEWNVTSPKSISKNIDKLSMVMHDNKYLLVTGSWYADSKPDATEMIVDCFDKNGALIWQAVYNPEGNSVPVALAVASDEDGNIYVTGYIIKAKSTLDYCTVKFSKN